MSLLSALSKLNDVNGLEQAFGEQDITTQEMRKNIQDCADLFYRGNSDYESNCQRIAALIINKLTKTMFAEYNVNSDDETVTQVLEALESVKEQAVKQLLLGGEIFLKPIYKDNRFYFRVITRDCFIPFARDIDGRITKVGMTERTLNGKAIYTLTEKREAGRKGMVVTYRLYRSDNTDELGQEVSLGSLPKYEDLEPLVFLPLPNSLGMIQIKTPVLNNVDGTNDGVCIYSSAVDLIKHINKNQMQLDDEMALSQKRIIAPIDMFRRDPKNGKPFLYDKVFTALENYHNDGSGSGIVEFSPPIRDENYRNVENKYLRNIENLIGLKHGLLADVSEEQKTATEITDSKGDYALTIADMQKVWTRGIEDTVRLCYELSRIYSISFPAYSDGLINYDYGDTVLYDRDKTFAEMLSLVSAGIISPVYLIGWYYDIDVSTPEGLEKAKAMQPEMERLINEL